ncbi:MAG TPA: c-type cytochrome [Acetobacteraceae bacterium]|nr:c-type cytochrome [Acetobacteraceae bacterium]
MSDGMGAGPRAGMIIVALAMIGSASIALHFGHFGSVAKASPAPIPAAQTTASAQVAAPMAVPLNARFQPPAYDALPAGQFGDAVKLGRDIFRHTPQFAGQYIGNTLSCSNCHLDAGRLAGSAPMWASYVAYPAYRKKNDKVNTFGERLQGCFRFSENGKAPALDSKVMVALESYSYWMSTKAPTGAKMPGRGYPDLPKPALPADYHRGEAVYAQNCALCHEANGAGQQAGGKTVFPALWGRNSFNWGAGMGSIKNAAAFIKANMPLGVQGSLTVQQAWDVAAYMDSQDRPQDPRYLGNVAATRAKFHNSPMSMYGKSVDGHILGSTP